MIAPNMTRGMVLSCLQEQNGKTAPVVKTKGRSLQGDSRARTAERAISEFGVPAEAGRGAGAAKNITH